MTHIDLLIETKKQRHDQLGKRINNLKEIILDFSNQNVNAPYENICNVRNIVDKLQKLFEELKNNEIEYEKEDAVVKALIEAKEKGDKNE
jgi:hypothetical protein